MWGLSPTAGCWLCRVQSHTQNVFIATLVTLVQNHANGDGEGAGPHDADGAGSPDYEGASMAPLTLPLDLSAAPSLSLPDAAAPAGAAETVQYHQQQMAEQQAQQQQQQAAAVAHIQASAAAQFHGLDDDRSRGDNNSRPASVQASSGEVSKRSSGDDGASRHSAERPRTPPHEGAATPDELVQLQRQAQQQQQQIDLRHPGHAHLVPVVDQRLDTWPPDSRSPANVRSAAQQIAQWQAAQQQQAQQQLAGIGATPAQWQQVWLLI